MALMPSFSTDNLLEELRSRNSRLESTFHGITGDLKPDEWNWKPSPEQWSLAQIVDHLLITNTCYLPSIQRALETAGERHSDQLKSSWFGDLIVKRMQPDPATKLKPIKAAKFLLPSSSTLDGVRISSQFNGQTRDLEQILIEMTRLEVGSLKVPLSFTNLLKMKIVDVLRIIIAHNDRHLLQMQRVKNLLSNHNQSNSSERP